MPKSETSLSELLYDIRRISEHREKLTEKKIRSIYQTLVKEINSFVAESYSKYADDDGRLYLSYLDAKNKRAKFLQEIVENVSGISPKLKKEIETLIDDTYSKSYKAMSESLKKANTTAEIEEVSKDIDVNPNVLKQAVNNNISKLTLEPVLQKHRAEIIYQIQQELNMGLMLGDRYEKMASRISERCNVSYSKAMNITRTETHRNIESGFLDAGEHIQDGLDGSDLIYAATWRNMGDERVRPQVRRKTKKGWKTTLSRNGANHIKMEGQTVKVGDFFDLGNGVKAKAPGKSGVAAHDCNCRCFLEYNLMTVDEFAKATGKSKQYVREKYNIAKDALNAETRQFMNDKGITDMHLQETSEKTRFDSAIKAAKEANPNGACVDTHTIKELRQYKTFLAKDDMAGVAVKPDGDITAVFKNSNSKAKGAVNDLIITARANGGTKMDCYGVGLVNMYEKCGYVPVARIPFNADYVSDPYLLKTRPDVYAMMKNTDKIETVIEKNAKKAYKLSLQEDLDKLPTFDYDEALEYRDKLLKAQK